MRLLLHQDEIIAISTNTWNSISLNSTVDCLENIKDIKQDKKFRIITANVKIPKHSGIFSAKLCDVLNNFSDLSPLIAFLIVTSLESSIIYPVLPLGC